MVKFIPIVILFLSVPALAQVCDVYGNCAEEEEDRPASRHQEPDNAEDDFLTRLNQKSQHAMEESEKEDRAAERLEGVMRLRTDANGTTSGFAGDEYVRTYTDSMGTTRGSIGDDRVDLYQNSTGSITGSVGDDRVNLYRNSLGGTSGMIGDRHVSCYTNSIGITSCH